MTGTLVICPPTTRRDLQLRSSILMSKIMWHLSNWNQCGTFLLSSRASNATLTFFISLAMSSTQRVDPDHLSIASESSTSFGRERPYLWVFFSTLTFQHYTRDMIKSLFLRTQNAHQLKPDSSATPIWIANSATWTGWDSLRLHSFSQEVEPSIHLQQMNQPFVDLCWQVH